MGHIVQRQKVPLYDLLVHNFVNGKGHSAVTMGTGSGIRSYTTPLAGAADTEKDDNHHTHMPHDLESDSGLSAGSHARTDREADSIYEMFNDSAPLLPHNNNNNEGSKGTYDAFPSLDSLLKGRNRSLPHDPENADSNEQIGHLSHTSRLTRWRQFVASRGKQCWEWQMPLTGRRALKSGLAYVFASLFTLIPVLRLHYGPSSYLCATGMAWYQPSRSLGAMVSKEVLFTL